jgi:hypothetical protein
VIMVQDVLRALEAWENLQRQYEGKNRVNVYALLTEFTRSILSNQVQISNFAKLGSNWLKKTCGPKP